MVDVMQTMMRMDRVVLLEKVRENRAHHKEVFDRAWSGYADAVARKLHGMITELDAGGDPSLYVRMTKPEDHTADYDAVISFLENGADPSIEISLKDYRQYALDEWDWREMFDRTASSYTEM